MDGPQMGVQVITGLPLFLEVHTVFSLHIHIAIAAYATLLAPNLGEYCLEGLKDLFLFVRGHRYLEATSIIGFLLVTLIKINIDYSLPHVKRGKGT
jgi:hypothetical protein